MHINEAGIIIKKMYKTRASTQSRVRQPAGCHGDRIVFGITHKKGLVRFFLVPIS